MVDVHYDSPFGDPDNDQNEDPYSYYERVGFPSQTPGVPYYVGTESADRYVKNKKIQDMLLSLGDLSASSRYIPQESRNRSNELDRYRAIVGNYGNAQAYDQRSQDLASMLAGGAMGQPRNDVYNNIYGMISSNAGNAQRQAQQAAAQTGLNRVAAARLGRDAQYDYMRGAQQKAQAGQALADQQRAMSAAEMLNTGISSRTGRGIDALNRKNQDAYLFDESRLMNLSDALNHNEFINDLKAYEDSGERNRRARVISGIFNAASSGAAMAGGA